MPNQTVIIATLLACAGQAVAQSAIDLVPQSCGVAMVVPNPALFVERAEALMGEDLAAQAPLGELHDLLALEGIRSDGMFVVGLTFEAEGEEPVELSFVPVADYATLMGSLEAVEEDGLHLADVDGESVYFRDLSNGFAVASSDAEQVRSYAKPGTSVFKAIASSSKKISDASEAMILVNFASADVLMDGVREGMAGGMAMNPAMPAGAGEAIGNMIDQFQENAAGLIVGLDIEDQGLTVLGALEFKEESGWGAKFTGGDSSKLLSKLPATPFLLAMAIDYTVPGLVELQQAARELQPGEGSPLQQFGFMEGINGMGAVIGMSPGVMTGQVFANTATYLATPDPKALVGKLKDAVAAADGLEAEGMFFATEYAEASADINGTPADLWTLKMDIDPDHPMAMQMEQMMVMFPGRKITGYTAASNGGVVNTLSKNKGLLEQTLGAASGEAPALAADPLLEAASKKLPEGRFFEMYIGVGEIFGALAPIMGFEPPVDLAPVAIGVGASGNAITFGLSVDKKVFTTIMEMQGGMMGPGMEEMPEDDADGGRF